MEKLIIIAGPTAVGKTSLSISLAKKIGGEIISADSMQIYKEMNIGTSKVTKDEMDGVKHHMIDIVSPNEEFTVAEYKEMATGIIYDIISRGKIPIMVGGTGLYIDSVTIKMSFSKCNKDESIRNELEKILAEEGRDALFDILKLIDPESAIKIHPNNTKRVIRAIEVFKVTGNKFSALQKEEKESLFKGYYYALNIDRNILYNRIDERVVQMVNQGLFQEVESLINKGYTREMQSMKAIGYKDVLDYFDGIYTKEIAIDKIKQYSRNYAKRQLTWFRNDSKFEFIDANTPQNKLVEEIYNAYFD